MRQFDVYRNQNAASRKRFPLLLDVQASLLEELESRMVIPLAEKSLFQDKALGRLMPTLVIEGTDYIAVTAQMASLRKRDLSQRVANLASARVEIIAAIDFLFTGS